MNTKKIHNSTIAGSWYPGSRKELEDTLGGFFSHASKKAPSKGLKAIVVPHAGYKYSGQVAMEGFSLLARSNIKRVIILAPSHSAAFEGACVPDYGMYRTPLGDVRVSVLTKELVKDPLITVMPQAHDSEHSIEIELPFLQHVLPEFEVVPILIGSLSWESVEHLAAIIAGLLDKQTLIVASSDLSHYLKYSDAVELDRSAIDSMLALDLDKASVSQMCGLFPVLVTMRIALMNGWEPLLLGYRNSGDVTGDKSSVVGYCSIGFYGQPSGFELDAKQKENLLRIARDAIHEYATSGRMLDFDVDDPVLKEKKGVFVTLEKDGILRGCIGSLSGTQELYLAVGDNAVNAAFNDPRFRPLEKDELPNIEIEISVLTTPERISAASPQELLDLIKPGVTGVIIECLGRRATYLPQVWEQISVKDDFMESLCIKAGLEHECWKRPDACIYIYKAIAFKERDFGQDDVY